MTNTQREYGWNEGPIENPQEDAFTLLPEGTYPFRVTALERARHNGSPKLPPCPVAIIHIDVDGGKLGTVTVKHRLNLHSVAEWALCQFFTGIGLRKSGEPLRMEWNKIVGRTGIAKVSIRNYNGKDYNEIKGFVESGDGQASQQPAAQQPAQQRDWRSASAADDDLLF